MNVAELTSAIHEYGMEIYAHTTNHQACFKNLRWLGNFSEKSHWTTWGIYPNFYPEYPVFERGSAYAYNGFWPYFDDDRFSFKRRSDAERYDFCLNDFCECYEKITAINQQNRQLFCWPWGEFDAISTQALKKAGFAGAFTLERSRNGHGKDPFRLSRILVGRTKPHTWLRARLRMHYPAVGANLFFKYFRKKNEINRVLYLTNSSKLSGGSRQLINNISAMSQCGVDTYLMAPPASEVTKALTDTATHIIPWGKMMKMYITSAIFLAKTTRKHQIDVVHTFHSKPMKIAVLAKLLGGGFRLYTNRGVVYTPNPLIAVFTAIADGVICNSKNAAEILRKYFVPDKKIHIIYNSFVDIPLRQKEYIKKKPGVIYVGNVNSVKGYDIFLKTAHEYFQKYSENAVKFLAYGIEEKTDFSRCIPQETLDKINSYTDVSHKEVLQALDNGDIFLLTSRMESMPNVILEAFSASLPVIATNVGGVKELIKNGMNGFICESEDVQCLAEHVHYLVEHPEVRKKMGEINKKIVSEYLHNRNKGYALLRAYSGDRIRETLPFDKIADIDKIFDLCD
jgi:glycosyltransferase involved in cell wall biosynthesis